MAIEQMPPTAPSIADFDYPDFYKAMVERERLQVAKDEAKWTEKHQPPERKIEVLLNFGCNVRQTPHLMREAVAVLDVLGVDFHAVAGQQYCCGKPYTGQGLKEAGRGVVEASVRRMASYQPERAIQWCSACEMQFADVVIPDIGIEFQSDGLAKFLIEKIDSMGDRVPWKKDVKVRAAIHGHLGEHRVRDAHPPVTIELLKRIPGVEFVEVAHTDALAFCDNNGLKIAAITSEEYLEAQRKLEEYLASAGADTLVTLYHSCTRELSKFQSERFRLRHYISLVAEALGVGKPDRFSEYWRLGEPAKVVEASRPNWESWGYSEAEAYRLAHRYFVPSYAVNAPDCPCNGECTATGASFLSAHKIDRAKELPMVEPKDLV
jgi:heterodisulfide reductase subunit D